ncbi:MAG: thioredoxin family protein [Bacilli bacterium]|nr:thioredoxin family protein [Bacilli bacterium]
MKLIKIGASWCSACLITNSRFYEVIKNFPDIEVIEYDYDFDNFEIEKYNVGKVIPVFILEKDGEVISRLVGERSKKEMIEFIERSI